MSEQAIEHGMDVPPGTEMPEGFELGDGIRRDSRCVTNWSDCSDGEYDPSCCRFPKSCSATSVPNRVYRAGILEPPTTRVITAGTGLTWGPTLGAVSMGYLVDWRAMFVKYVTQILYRESYDFLDEVEWTPEEEAAVEQAAEEARSIHTASPPLP